MFDAFGEGALAVGLIGAGRRQRRQPAAHGVPLRQPTRYSPGRRRAALALACGVDLRQEVLGRAIRGLLLHRGGGQLLRRIEIARGQRLPGQLRVVVRGDGHRRAGLRQAPRVDQRQACAAVGPGQLHQLAEIGIGGPGGTGSHFPAQRLRPVGPGHRHLHVEGTRALVAAHDHRVAVQPQGRSPLGEDLGERGRVGDRLRPEHGTLHRAQQLGAQFRAGRPASLDPTHFPPVRPAKAPSNGMSSRGPIARLLTAMRLSARLPTS